LGGGNATGEARPERFSRRETLALIGAAALAPVPGTARADEPVLAIEDAEFAAPDGVILRGAVYRQADEAPRAAVTIVHGAGQNPSRYEDWGRIYASAGFAALIYDKRGCGQSGGEYVGNSNTAAANLVRLAGDAVAAAAWLRSQSFASGIVSGFAGPSQAGWIIPPAALLTGADFMLLLSGPVCTTSQSQEFEAQGADGPLRYARFLREESETDPLPVLRQLDIPGFWIFGGKDRNVPVDICVRNLDALIAGGRPYQYHIDPDAGHFQGSAAHQRAIAWLEERFPALAKAN